MIHHRDPSDITRHKQHNGVAASLQFLLSMLPIVPETMAVRQLLQ